MLRKTALAAAIIIISGISAYLLMTNTEKKPVNIVYILCDALRADHVGCYGYHRDTTPFLDRLAEEGIMCRTVYAHSSWTFPSTASHLTGVNPVASYRQDMALSTELDFISEILAGNGYHTYMVSANPLLKENYNIAQGFHVYRYIHSSDGIDVNNMVEDMCERELEEPFFIYIHYMDTHEPLYPPPEYLDRLYPSIEKKAMNLINRKVTDLSPKEMKIAVDLYDAEVLYQDHLISSIYDFFEKNRAFENETLWLITSDHGDEFGDHGGTGHGVTLYNEVLNVPLILHCNDRLPGNMIIERPVQVIDIVPTILDICSIPFYADQYEGMSLLSDEPRDFYAFAALWKAKIEGKNDSTLRCIITDEWKYIHSYDDEKHELYNLINDPEERLNIIGRFPKQAEKLSKMLMDYVRQNIHIYDYPEPGPEADENEEIEERIRALGYIN